MTASISPQEPQTRLFGAVNSARVAVAASIERVYAVLLERSSWMEGFLDKVLIDGPVNAPGERARYKTRAGERVEEVLVATPPHRYVTRLADVEDRRTHAFAEWRIEQTVHGSAIEFNLYWLDSAPNASSWDHVQCLRTDYQAQTQEALENHLARIKDAAEASEKLND